MNFTELYFKIRQYAQICTIVLVMILSMNGMWNAENHTTTDTIFSCLFCLSVVMLVDRDDPK